MVFDHVAECLGDIPTLIGALLIPDVEAVPIWDSAASF
jgi:hypothetical protein